MLEWILSCQRSLILRSGCIKDLFCRYFFAAVVNVITEVARAGVLSELLYAYLILMSETIKGLTNKFRKWKILLSASV